MGVRTLLTAYQNRSDGPKFEVWEEANGKVQAYQNGSPLVAAETNPLTGGISLLANGTYISVGKHGSKSPSVNFGDMFSLSDVSIVSGSPALSIVTGPNGNQALKIVTGVSTNAEITFPALVGATYGGEFYASVSGGYADGVAQYYWYATPDANYSTNFFSGPFTPATAPVNSPVEQGGAFTVRIGPVDGSVTGSITYPLQINAHKLRIIPRAGMSATVYLYGIGFSDQPTKGRISVICDDGYDSWFQAGQPIFDKLGIPVTCAVIPANINSGYASGYAFMRQLRSLVNRGGAVVAHGPNSSFGVGNLISSLPDTASRVADMVAVRKWIFENSLDVPGCELCYVWPQGIYQSAYQDLSLLNAALNAGFTTGRNANGLSVGFYGNFDAASKYGHLCLPIIGHLWAGTTATEATNITAITTAINNAAAQGSDVTLMFHRVQPTATSDGSMSAIGIRVGDLATIANAIAAKVTAGTLEAVTLAELAIAPKDTFWMQQ